VFSCWSSSDPQSAAARPVRAVRPWFGPISSVISLRSKILVLDAKSTFTGKDLFQEHGSAITREWIEWLRRIHRRGSRRSTR